MSPALLCNTVGLVQSWAKGHKIYAPANGSAYTIEFIILMAICSYVCKLVLLTQATRFLSRGLWIVSMHEFSILLTILTMMGRRKFKITRPLHDKCRIRENLNKIRYLWNASDSIRMRKGKSWFETRKKSWKNETDGYDRAAYRKSASVP